MLSKQNCVPFTLFDHFCWLNYFNLGMGVRSYLYIDKGSVHDSIAPLNLDLGISNQLCRVAIPKTIKS